MGSHCFLNGHVIFLTCTTSVYNINALRYSFSINDMFSSFELRQKRYYCHRENLQSRLLLAKCVDGISSRQLFKGDKMSEMFYPDVKYSFKLLNLETSFSHIMTKGNILRN